MVWPATPRTVATGASASHVNAHNGTPIASSGRPTRWIVMVISKGHALGAKLSGPCYNMRKYWHKL